MVASASHLIHCKHPAKEPGYKCEGSVALLDDLLATQQSVDDLDRRGAVGSRDELGCVGVLYPIRVTSLCREETGLWLEIGGEDLYIYIFISRISPEFFLF